MNRRIAKVFEQLVDMDHEETVFNLNEGACVCTYVVIFCISVSGGESASWQVRSSACPSNAVKESKIPKEIPNEIRRKIKKPVLLR